MTREDLAELAIKTLDTQREFFAAKGGTREKVDALDRSKALEKLLRKECERVLGGQSTMFDDEG
jgi:hypothetical protein